jgi:hypothetical protein
MEPNPLWKAQEGKKVPALYKTLRYRIRNGPQFVYPEPH